MKLHLPKESSETTKPLPPTRKKMSARDGGSPGTPPSHHDDERTPAKLTTKRVVSIHPLSDHATGYAASSQGGAPLPRSGGGWREERGHLPPVKN